MVKKHILASINRIAEIHFFLRPFLIGRLKETELTAGSPLAVSGAKNYYEFWERSFSDRFFDMGTLIRLGSELENGLKRYYMDKVGHKNLEDLTNDASYKTNIFQRVMPWTQDSAIDLYKSKLGYDLNTNAHFNAMQELMLYRHLYAHTTGLVSKKFIEDYEKLLGVEPLKRFPELAPYPAEDVYFFAPLLRITDLITESRRFFEALP